MLNRQIPGKGFIDPPVRSCDRLCANAFEHRWRWQQNFAVPERFREELPEHDAVVGLPSHFYKTSNGRTNVVGGKRPIPV